MPNRIAAQPLSVPVTMRMTTISAIIVRIARSAIPMFFVMNAPGGDRDDGGRVGAPFNLYINEYLTSAIRFSIFSSPS